MWEEGELSRNIQKNDEYWRREYANREEEKKIKTETAAAGEAVTVILLPAAHL